MTFVLTGPIHTIVFGIENVGLCQFSPPFFQSQQSERVIEKPFSPDVPHPVPDFSFFTPVPCFIGEMLRCLLRYSIRKSVDPSLALRHGLTTAHLPYLYQIAFISVK